MCPARFNLWRTQFQIFSWIAWICLFWLSLRWIIVLELWCHLLVFDVILKLPLRIFVAVLKHQTSKKSMFCICTKEFSLTGFDEDRRGLWSKGSSCYTCWTHAQGALMIPFSTSSKCLLMQLMFFLCNYGQITEDTLLWCFVEFSNFLNSFMGWIFFKVFWP